MKGFGFGLFSLLGASLFASSAVAADASSIDPLIISGKHFYYQSNGTEFFIKGVAYQQDYQVNASASSNAGYTDPLADLASCQRDIPYLVELSTNVIRTYAIDPTKNHDDCMNAFAEAGIYVISDLSQPTESIDRDDPSWNDDLYNRYASVIDSMSKYNNVIGFFAGNEVSNAPNVTEASAFVKAAVRDMKAYIKNQGYRQTYVGYATYDGPILMELADYFNCGDPVDAIDFWGYNIYSWCGPQATYESSGYEARTEAFRNYSVPTFFAEYGCNLVQPRQFTEVRALFGPQMAPVWSGGIVYMYFQTTNNFGLVQIEGNSVSKLEDFAYLSMELKTNIPKGTPLSASSPTLPPQACPPINANWMATASPLPPTPNGALCECLVNALSCTVNDGTPTTKYGDIFGYICGNDPKACDGIQHNATTGDYGAYSVCNDEQQLSYAMNEWWVQHGGGASSCDFNGAGKLVSAPSPSGSCASLISAAGGAQGQGTVVPPSGKATAAATGGSGSSSSSSSAGAAFVVGVPSFDMGVLSISISVAAAVLTGAGMILL